VLSLAAVIGREFDATLVERVANLGVAAGDALAEAEDAGLIQSIAREGRYAFAHALVRQTLYGDLRPSRRVALHRTVAEALEAQSRHDPEPHLADLAHHYYHAAAAGVADRAVLYTTRAAEQAVRQLAYEEAAMQYERALHALQLGPTAPGDTRQAAMARAELLLALGDAQRSSGTQALWRPTYRRAAAAARAALGTSRAGEAARLLARAALAVGRSSETGTVDEELLGLVQDALAALGDSDPVSRARLLARYAIALYFSPGAVGGEALSREALALAQETGDAPTVVRCLVALHCALWRPDHLDERERVATQLVQLAEQAREHEMAIEGRLWLLVDQLERGDGQAVAREMDAVARAASASRHPLYRWHAELHRAMRALADGRVDEAERLSSAALHFGERAGLQNPRQAFGAQTFWIRREQGRLAELEEHLRGLAERFQLPIWRCGLALLQAETGRVDEARRALGPLVENDFAALRIDGNWLPGMATLAQACTEVGDRVSGRRIYDRLLPYADRVVVIAQAHVCLGPVAYFLGRLAALDERWDEAVAHFEAAIRIGTGIDAALLVAYARCGLASALQAHAPDSPSTMAAIAAAAQAAQPLGLARLSAQIPPRAPSDVSAPPSASMSAPTAARAAVFRNDGDYWTIAFDGTESRLKHSRGLLHLAELLRHPDREVHALDLATRFRGEPGTGTEAAGGDAGTVLDDTAKAAYRERLDELRAEIEEATTRNDLGGAERAREEMEVLTQELSAAVGLGRRDRRTHSNAERSRIAVTKAVSLALRAIAETNPALRRYLAGTIKTGQFCSYTPDPRFPVAWTLS
jgi:hypothetical protein